MESTAQNTERLNFRLAPSAKQRIEHAAAIKSMTLTQFALLTLMREADEVLKSNHVLVLSDRDRDQFLAALDNPPALNAKLLKSAKAYKAARANGKLRST